MFLFRLKEFSVSCRLPPILPQVNNSVSAQAKSSVAIDKKNIKMYKKNRSAKQSKKVCKKKKKLNQHNSDKIVNKSNEYVFVANNKPITRNKKKESKVKLVKNRLALLKKNKKKQNMGKVKVGMCFDHKIFFQEGPRKVFFTKKKILVVFTLCTGRGFFF